MLQNALHFSDVAILFGAHACNKLSEFQVQSLCDTRTRVMKNISSLFL